MATTEPATALHHFHVTDGYSFVERDSFNLFRFGKEIAAFITHPLHHRYAHKTIEVCRSCINRESIMPGNRYLAILLLLCLCSGIPASTQTRYTFSQFGDETGTFFLRPLHWNGNDWLKLGLMGAGTFLSMQADDQIRTDVLKDRRYVKSVPIVGGRVWGELYMPVALFTLYGGHSLITGDESTRKIAYEIGQAAIYAGTITYLLKSVIGRARPYTNEGSSSYHAGSLFDDDYHSLPGGHSTAAFVLSTVLSRNAHSTLLKGVAYVPAVFTFISRVYQDEHWFSDDLLGATLGYFVATWVVDQHEGEDSRIGLVSAYPLSIRIIIN